VLHRFAIAVATLPESALPESGLAGSAAPKSAAAATGPDWTAYGRRLIGCLIKASGTAPARVARGDAAEGESVARKVWQKWSPLRPTASRVRALNAALVLLAEHELALSTLSVRVAASARATPSACVLAGLSTLSGALHGGAARVLHETLAGSPATAAQAAGGRQAAAPSAAPFGHPAPMAFGHPAPVAFGHLVHRHGDPRTGPILDAVYGFATRADRDLVEDARRAAPDQPNVDFALGALTYAARMPSEAATAIFAIARVAGWIAHAAEEYGEPPLRFRGRALQRLAE
jgi:citrate synthase